MTTKTSFFKLYKETIKHHLASLILVLFSFLVYFIIFFINFQNILQRDWVTSISSIEEWIMELCSPQPVFAIFATAIGAYLAFDYFRYMHSRKEVDFYESLPRNRKTTFKLHFLCGFSIFTVLVICTLALELFVVFLHGYGSFTLFQNILWKLLIMIGCYLSSWATASLAMILTGNSLVGIMGYGGLSVYFPVLIRYLIPLYAEEYFLTYFDILGLDWLYFLSPASLAYKVSQQHVGIWNASEHIKYFIGIWIFSIVLCFLTYFLYKKRPCEAAGRAMAFEKLNPIFRFFLVIPLALYVGLFLRSMSFFGQSAWNIFGILLGCVVIHGALECIFHFDIKVLFTKKRQLLLSILLCMGFYVTIQFDLVGFDSYIPSLNKLEAIHFQPSYNAYVEFSSENFNNGIRGEQLSLAHEAASQLIETSTNITSPENLEQTADMMYPPANTVEYKWIRVTYVLKNGRMKIRNYRFANNAVPEALDKLSVTTDFKDDLCSLYSSITSDYTSVSCGTYVNNFALELSAEERQQLIQLYLDEYTAMPISEFYNTPYDMELCFTLPWEDESGYEYASHQLSYYYPVANSFQKTIQFLKSHGVVSFRDDTSFKLLSLTCYGLNETDDSFGEKEIMITDPEIIEDLKPHMKLNLVPLDQEYTYCYIHGTYEYNEIYTEVYLPTELLLEYAKAL